MPTLDVNFQNKLGHTLQGVVRFPDKIYLEDEGKYPAVIILHGFKENKEHALYSTLGNIISPSGYVTLRFDFHGHGESGGSFDEHTITQQINDVESAIDFLQQQIYVNPEKIAVFGHEIGGDVAILAAARDSRIKCLVLQGARSELELHIKSHLVAHDLEELERTGYVEQHDFGLKKQYLTHLRHYIILDEVKKVEVPVLVVHGDSDYRTKISEARALFGAANEPKAYEFVEDADHWFRGKENQLVNIVLTWLNKWMK